MGLRKILWNFGDVCLSSPDFIAGAPDSGTATKGVKKGNKQQISLTMTPALLAKVDALAEKMGQSRAAVINMAVYRAVEAE